MAVTRWFANIIAKANLWMGSTIVAEVDKDTFFISFSVQTDASNKLSAFRIYGTPKKTGFKIQAFRHPALSTELSFSVNTVTQVKELTIIYPICQVAANDTWVVAYGTFAVFDKKSSIRTTKIVLDSLTDRITTNLIVANLLPDQNVWVGENMANPATTPIVQPAHQGGGEQGLVADELNIVSDSDNDTSYGWDSVIKGTPPYTGATANGLTQAVTYYLKVDVGAGIVEYNFTAGVASDMDSLITQLEAIPTLDALVSWAILDGELRCTNKIEFGTVSLSAGSTGADIFATLTDYDSLHGAVLPNGMQKAQFTYYDAAKALHLSAEFTLKGKTPVDIIASVADLYLTKAFYGTQWGSVGHNFGNIFLQENV